MEKAADPGKDDAPHHYRIIYHNLGRLHQAWGKHAEALKYHQKALAIVRRLAGRDHPDLAESLTGIGRARVGLGEASKAVEPLEQALGIYKGRDLDPARIADARFALAQALWKLKRDRRRARDLARQARDGYTRRVRRYKRELDQVNAWLTARGIRVR